MTAGWHGPPSPIESLAARVRGSLEPNFLLNCKCSIRSPRTRHKSGAGKNISVQKCLMNGGTHARGSGRTIKVRIIGCMLVELTVENYAVIDRLRVRFHAGLNLLTGETGSGKSIVVDALGLLLGGRASAEMIRSGEERARVAGIFEVRDSTRLHALLDPGGFEVEDGEL